MRTSMWMALVGLSGCIFVVPESAVPNRSFPDGMTELSLTVPVGDVSVVVSDDPGLAVSSTYTGGDANGPDLDTNHSGTVADYTWTCPRAAAECSVDLTVRVPPSLQSLTIHTDIGDVDVEGVSSALTVSSGAGDVVLVGHTGSVDLLVDIGTVQARDLCAEWTYAEASGDVGLVLCDRPSEVTVVSDLGDIDVELPAGAYVVDATTATGTVDIDASIEVDPKADASVDARTEAGDIRLSGAIVR